MSPVLPIMPQCISLLFLLIHLQHLPPTSNTFLYLPSTYPPPSITSLQIPTLYLQHFFLTSALHLQHQHPPSISIANLPPSTHTSP
ncbi:hypothetical protein Hamer_G023676 [Homarus americanus]|uniref:Uncharacterized protein n=1 Tax=Homarus americanus TaxID=6706 RepID=A0A8J5MLA1_HOMAM|nr:hypothetical protein Hamer_G023676 [Homarus americanus]